MKDHFLRSVLAFRFRLVYHTGKHQITYASFSGYFHPGNSHCSVFRDNVTILHGQQEPSIPKGKIAASYPDSLAYPGNLTDDNQDYRALLAPFFKVPEDVKQWMNEKFESNPDFPEALIVPTKCGIMVRSKSESIIADALYEHGIPFHYEQLLLIGELKFYPDFTILDSREPRRLIYWEHLGRMDDPHYINRNRFKLGNYLEAGLIPGINLILTCETKENPLDVNYVLLMISYFFE